LITQRTVFIDPLSSIAHEYWGKSAEDF